MVRDSREATLAAFQSAAAQADVIITSGGVSVGAADFVTETLEQHGRIGFWKVAMKPGKPIAYGRFGEAVFFGLPGNPVSVMVTFYQVVRPALLALMGIASCDPPLLLRAVCESRIRKKPGRLEFQRGVYEASAQGGYVVRTTGHQGAGVLRSMSEANCFIVLPLEHGDVEHGVPKSTCSRSLASFDREQNTQRRAGMAHDEVGGKREFVPVGIAVLTVSDSRDEQSDKSGRLLVERLTRAGHRMVEKAIVPDDIYEIRAVVSRWIANPQVNAVITTGGTGVTGRDGTPEAILPLLDKVLDGFGEMFRSISHADIGTSTLQSRALGGGC